MKFAHVDEFAHCSVWFFSVEELLHRVLIGEVEFAMTSSHQVIISSCLEVITDGRTHESAVSFQGSGDRFRWPVRNVNILSTSHIPNYQCRFQIPRHQEETHIPCCNNGRHRLSPFELWSMERL